MEKWQNLVIVPLITVFTHLFVSYYYLKRVYIIISIYKDRKKKKFLFKRALVYTQRST